MQIHLQIFLKAVFQVCKASEKVTLTDAKHIFLAATRALDVLTSWNQDEFNRVICPNLQAAIIKTYWSFL